MDACRYFAALLVGAVRGIPKDTLLQPRYEPVAGTWAREPLTDTIDEVASGSFCRGSPPEIRGTGHVVRCLEAALWAFATTDDSASGALAAVNLGDDADTTGAVYGQIAGAAYGVRAIPEEWRAALAHGPALERLASSLADAATER